MDGMGGGGGLDTGAWVTILKDCAGLSGEDVLEMLEKAQVVEEIRWKWIARQRKRAEKRPEGAGINQSRKTMNTKPGPVFAEVDGPDS